MDTQNQKLDPTVVSLSRALGQAESGGNYQSQSMDKGSSNSAYGFTPGFIENYGPKFLPSYSGSDHLTPAQQDELSYNVVQDWGTNEKLSPAQIASKWNTGDPNAYIDPEYGKNNSYGSTQNYVHTVEDNYQKNLKESEVNVSQNQSSQTNQSINSNPSLSDWLLGGVANAGKWLLGNGRQIAASGIPIVAGTIGGGLGTLVPGLGETGVSEVAGAIGGEKIGEGIVGMLGLNNQPSNQNNNTTQTQSTDQSTPSTLQELQGLNMVDANKNSSKLASLLSDAMQTIEGNRRLAQDPNIQNGIGTIGMFGEAPSITKNGTMDFSQGMKNMQDKLGFIHKNATDILSKEDSVGDFGNMKQEAMRIVKERLPKYEWEQAAKYINETVGSYGQEGSPANLGVFQRIKQETGAGKKWALGEKTNAKNEAFKAMSLAARHEIEKNTKHPNVYNGIMKMEQNMLNAKNVMKRLNGKKAKINEGLAKSLLHAGGKAAAVYVGDKIGGPVGALIAYMIEGQAAKTIDKKFGKTAYETKAMTHAIEELKKTSPTAYKVLVGELEKQQVSISDLEDKATNEEPNISIESKKKSPNKGLLYGNELPPLNQIRQGKNKLYKGYIQNFKPKIA